jgi:hypothetical protein
MTTIINLNNHPVHAKINTPKGSDYVHIMPKGRVTLPTEVTVDGNWLAGADKVKVVKPITTENFNEGN